MEGSGRGAQEFSDLYFVSTQAERLGNGAREWTCCLELHESAARLVPVDNELYIPYRQQYLGHIWRESSHTVHDPGYGGSSVLFAAGRRKSTLCTAIFSVELVLPPTFDAPDSLRQSFGSTEPASIRIGSRESRHGSTLASRPGNVWTDPPRICIVGEPTSASISATAASALRFSL